MESIIWNNYEDTVLGYHEYTVGYDYHGIIVYVNGNPISQIPSEATYRIQYWKIASNHRISRGALDLNDEHPVIDFSISGKENPRDLEIMYGKLLRMNVKYKYFTRDIGDDRGALLHNALDHITLHPSGGRNVAIKPLSSYLKGLTILVQEILDQEGLPEREPMTVAHISQRKKGYSHVQGKNGVAQS